MEPFFQSQESNYLSEVEQFCFQKILLRAKCTLGSCEFKKFQITKPSIFKSWTTGSMHDYKKRLSTINLVNKHKSLKEIEGVQSCIATSRKSGVG